MKACYNYRELVKAYYEFEAKADKAAEEAKVRTFKAKSRPSKSNINAGYTNTFMTRKG